MSFPQSDLPQLPYLKEGGWPHPFASVTLHPIAQIYFLHPFSLSEMVSCRCVSAYCLSFPSRMYYELKHLNCDLTYFDYTTESPASQMVTVTYQGSVGMHGIDKLVKIPV